MDLTEIRKIGQNEANIRWLVEQCERSGGMRLFVGAGLSVPFGFKAWREFLIAQGQRAGIENNQ